MHAYLPYLSCFLLAGLLTQRTREEDMAGLYIYPTEMGTYRVIRTEQW